MENGKNRSSAAGNRLYTYSSPLLLAPAATHPKQIDPAVGVCRRPSTTLRVFRNIDGTLHALPCRPEWMEDPGFKPRIHTLRDIQDFWNGVFMEKLRESVSSKDYRYCSSTRCPYLSTGSVADSVPDTVANGVLSPSVLEYGADINCTRGCSVCRTGQRSDCTNDIDVPLCEMLDMGVSKMVANCGGEFFVSRRLISFARTFHSSRNPNLRDIVLVTNGTLLDKEMWFSLSEDFRSTVSSVVVAIDSSAEISYNLNKSHDRSSRLRGNLVEIGALRALGEIKDFSMSFSVSSDNVVDLLGFISLAGSLSADSVRVNGIVNKDLLGLRYREKAIHLPDHPNHHLYAQVVAEARAGAERLGIKWKEEVVN